MKVEVWVLVDELGGTVATTDATKLADLYDEEIGLDASTARRVVKITLDIEAPKPVELTATIPPEAAPGPLTIQERYDTSVEAAKPESGEGTVRP